MHKSEIKFALSDNAKDTYGINSEGDIYLIKNLNPRISYDDTISIIAKNSEGSSYSYSLTIQFGTASAESLNGNNHQTIIFGQGGADEIVGSSKDDYLSADAQVAKGQNAYERGARILGGNGGDHIVAGSRADIVTGGSGEDGNDKLLGQKGNDELFGGLGNDILKGGAGDDNLYGYKGQIVLMVVQVTTNYLARMAMVV